MSLKLSPSSIYNWFLITLSLVILFPKIFIFSTKNFSVSSIMNCKLILLSAISSLTKAWIASYCSDIAILSNSSSMFSTEFIEYGSFSRFLKTLFNLLKLVLSKSAGIFKLSFPK